MPADLKSNDYHFVTRWEVPGTCEAASDVVGNPLDLPRWWPSVYLKVEQLGPPDARGLGRRVRPFAQRGPVVDVSLKPRRRATT